MVRMISKTNCGDIMWNLNWVVISSKKNWGYNSWHMFLYSLLLEPYQISHTQSIEYQSIQQLWLQLDIVSYQNKNKN